MPALPRFWSALTTADFAQIDTARAIAVLPVGATEQHGPHLPLSVDADLAHAIVQAAAPLVADEVPAFFLPVQAIGYSPEHAHFAGTLTLRPETALRLWSDIAESVAASGVRKLVLFNTHGGNAGLLDGLARELRARLRLLIYRCNWFDLPLLDEDGGDLMARFSPQERRFGVHAGQVETAFMLAAAPHAVRRERAEHFRSSSEARARGFALLGNGKSARFAWAAQDLHPSGAAGNARAATAGDGQALIAAAARALADLLAEIDRLPPELTLHDNPHLPTIQP